MKARGKHSRTARLAVVVAAVVVLAAVLVAPALAAPAQPTSWTVSPESKTITYGQGVTLNGTLMSNGVAVGGLWVDFAQAMTEGGSYEVLYKVTTSDSAYYSGTYSVAVMPLQTMYYRFQWAGDSIYADSNSDVIPVSVKPSLGKPTYPSSVKSGHKFTVSGSVKPGAPTGPKVKVKAYRYNGHGYVNYKTYSTTISGTTYKASIKISKTGKYKFKATTGSSAQFVANETSLGAVLKIKG